MRHRDGNLAASFLKSTRMPRALVVEYDRWLRTTIAALVAEVGYEVTTASNGYSGLRLALAVHPNLIVLGRALPELPTDALCDELRRAMPGSEAQIIDDRAFMWAESDLIPLRLARPLHAPDSTRGEPANRAVRISSYSASPTRTRCLVLTDASDKAVPVTKRSSISTGKRRGRAPVQQPGSGRMQARRC